ncbi:MAG: CBS domain-containing protein [Gemmatimonadota bacterium]|jgi:CBS domain-containing protein|nr:MAG: CBS domain-containing protein [Gemmatimonadota bacterium]
MVRLHDIMSVRIKTLTPNMTLRDAAEFLASEHIGGAPVLSGDRVVGVVSATDLLDFVSSNPGPPTPHDEQTEWTEPEEDENWSREEEASATYFEEYWADAGAQVDERFRQTNRPEWDVLEEHVVSEIMTRRLCELPPETDVQTAAEFMLKSAIHRVLVTKDTRLVGVVSSTDVVKAVARYGLGG